MSEHWPRIIAIHHQPSSIIISALAVGALRSSSRKQRRRRRRRWPSGVHPPFVGHNYYYFGSTFIIGISFRLSTATATDWCGRERTRPRRTIHPSTGTIIIITTILIVTFNGVTRAMRWGTQYVVYSISIWSSILAFQLSMP